MFRVAVCALIVAVSVVSVSAAQDAKARGQKVFTDQKCALCHSVAGKGNTKGSLDNIGGKLSPDDIRAWITDAKGMTAKSGATRKPAMKEYTLAKDDVDALVAYLSALKSS